MSEAKGVLEQAIEYWNAGDRDAWATLYAEDVVYEAPGGQRISGLTDLKEKYFDTFGNSGSSEKSIHSRRDFSGLANGMAPANGLALGGWLVTGTDFFNHSNVSRIVSFWFS